MPSFLDARDIVNEGDTAIIYINYGSCYVVNVRRGQTLTMKYGALRHEFLIGKALSHAIFSC
jgi:tRNA A58 N-methylase Trm61